MRNLLSLLVVAVVLVAGNEAMNQWAAMRSAQSDLVTLARLADTVRAARHAAASAVVIARVDAFRSASIVTIDRRIAEIDQFLKDTRSAQSAPIMSLPLDWPSELASRAADYYTRQIDIEIRQQEREYLMQVRAYGTAVLDKNDAARLQAQARLAQQRSFLVYQDSHQKIERLEKEARFQTWLGFRSNELTNLIKVRKTASLENAQAKSVYLAQNQVLVQLAAIKNLNPFAFDQKRIDAVTAPLYLSLAKAQTIVSENWISRLSRPIIAIMPTAALVLLSAFLAHLAIKASFYYVLAPMASRLKPICLDHTASGTIAARAEPEPSLAPVNITSAVSQVVNLTQNEHMLILNDCLQSSSLDAKKDTKWLLDWSCPLTSLISGMCMLTRIRSTGAQPIVISASDDPLSEIALITLPAGSAMVFQPRGMVGVIYDAHTPLKITRRWRLASAQAWLTLQLRYLIFRGPVTLIVKGRRGVRVEPAGDGRTIGQSSTLGFSANIYYSTHRCDTFYPFYQSKVNLFQDSFAGTSGYYVYDETPGAGRKPGMVERTFEGLADAVLKVFGI